MSEISTVADRLAIIDVVTRMFVYTDQKRWEELLSEVFTSEVDLEGDHASLHADAIAVHVKNAASHGSTRTFVGSYVIGVARAAAGWRVDKFHYLLKVIDGNADLT